MGKNEAYVEKRKAQLEEYKAKLKVLKAKAKQQVAEGKIKGHRELDRLETKLDEAKLQLRKLARTGEDSWQEVKTGVENAWDELKTAASAVQKKFK